MSIKEKKNNLFPLSFAHNALRVDFPSRGVKRGVLNPLEFMTDSVMPYLFDENPKIRLEAVEAFTCLQFKEKSMNNL